MTYFPQKLFTYENYRVTGTEGSKCCAGEEWGQTYRLTILMSPWDVYEINIPVVAVVLSAWHGMLLELPFLHYIVLGLSVCLSDCVCVSLSSWLCIRIILLFECESESRHGEYTIAQRSELPKGCTFCSNILISGDPHPPCCPTCV